VRPPDRGPRGVLPLALSTPTAIFPEILNGLMFRSILRMCVGLQDLKFVALPVPEIIGGTEEILDSRRIRPCSLFSKKFDGLLFRWTL